MLALSQAHVAKFEPCWVDFTYCYALLSPCWADVEPSCVDTAFVACRRFIMLLLDVGLLFVG